jgi:hypothetical protein
MSDYFQSLTVGQLIELLGNLPADYKVVTVAEEQPSPLLLGAVLFSGSKREVYLDITGELATDEWWMALNGVVPVMELKPEVAHE